MILLGATIYFSTKSSRLDNPLTVVHLPPTGEEIDQNLKHTRYYRTEIRNNSNVPMTILRFEGCSQIEGKWHPNNIRRRTLTSQDFSEWYTEGDQIINGVIPAGKIATCDTNWHGGNSLPLAPCKWVFMAEDENGNLYGVQSVVDHKITKLVTKADN